MVWQVRDQTRSNERSPVRQPGFRAGPGMHLTSGSLAHSTPGVASSAVKGGGAQSL